MMEKIRISAIRYANTFPLNYGLRESGFDSEAVIDIDHPAQCAEKLRLGRADIGLVPVAEIRNIKGARIISDYCIGTNSPVRTVLLVSDSPLAEIGTIWLDYRSRSSVALARVLASEHWKQDFTWKQTYEDFDFGSVAKGEGLVIIGDQCFDLEERYRYRTDLASEWKDLTGLPFVFACWVSNMDPGKEFIRRFNSALEYGIKNIDMAIKKYSHLTTMPEDILKSYLTENIDYRLNSEKRLAMNTFFDYLDKQNMMP